MGSGLVNSNLKKMKLFCQKWDYPCYEFSFNSVVTSASLGTACLIPVKWSVWILPPRPPLIWRVEILEIGLFRSCCLPAVYVLLAKILLTWWCVACLEINNIWFLKHAEEIVVKENTTRTVGEYDNISVSLFQ